MSTSSTRLVLVCGATGQTGSAAVAALLRASISVKALVRNAASDGAQQLQKNGATIVTGNYNDMASLKEALQGVHACFLCCANQPSQVALETNVIDAAEASETCTYLVKIGTCGIKGPTDETPDYTSLNSLVEYGRFHAAIEDRLSRCKSLSWTCLRPNHFMQNHAGDIFGTLPKKMIVYPHMNAKASIVDTRDVGEIAAKLLLLEDISEHSGKCYNVCGPRGWSIHELALLYTSVLGTSIEAVKCDAASYQAGMVGAGFPEWLSKAVTIANMTFWAVGAADYESSPEIKEMHPQFRTMEQWVEEMAPMVKFDESA